MLFSKALLPPSCCCRNHFVSQNPHKNTSPAKKKKKNTKSHVTFYNLVTHSEKLSRPQKPPFFDSQNLEFFTFCQPLFSFFIFSFLLLKFYSQVYKSIEISK